MKAHIVHHKIHCGGVYSQKKGELNGYPNIYGPEFILSGLGIP